jgi:hypothetical protein
LRISPVLGIELRSVLLAKVGDKRYVRTLCPLPRRWSIEDHDKKLGYQMVGLFILSQLLKPP